MYSARNFSMGKACLQVTLSFPCLGGKVHIYIYIICIYLYIYIYIHIYTYIDVTCFGGFSSEHGDWSCLVIRIFDSECPKP